MSKRIASRRPVKVSKTARLLHTLLEANLVEAISGTRGTVRIVLVGEVVLKGRAAREARRLQAAMEVLQEAAAQ